MKTDFHLNIKNEFRNTAYILNLSLDSPFTYPWFLLLETKFPFQSNNLRCVATTDIDKCIWFFIWEECAKLCSDMNIGICLGVVGGRHGISYMKAAFHFVCVRLLPIFLLSNIWMHCLYYHATSTFIKNMPISLINPLWRELFG